jgi:4-hydroxythreonine-4-phosphate dehydrogenase
MEGGLTDTLVTGPISKHWAHQAGFEFPGHTELLGSEYSADPLMVLAGGGLRVALLTIHEQLAMVPLLIRKDGVRAVANAFHRSLVRDFGIENPRIGVCGLNPHAGEGGKFGREEIDVIAPVVQDLNRQGLKLFGPLAADSIFPKALKGEFDGVIAMYHDQGLIPVKTLAFDSAVNFTANLPVIRTSPDHGTAFDIAGKGVASCGSMLAAIELADLISRRRLEDSLKTKSGRQASVTATSR